MPVESLHAYLGHLREQAAGRASSGGTSLVEARSEQIKTEREISQLKLLKMRGEVLTLDEVSASWSGFASAVRAAVMTIPSKLRSTIPHLTAHDSETAKRVCRDILQDLSEEVKASVIGGSEKSIRGK